MIKTLAQVEREYIEYVLKYTRGDKESACRLLGIASKTIYNKLDKFAKEDEAAKVDLATQAAKQTTTLNDMMRKPVYEKVPA